MLDNKFGVCLNNFVRCILVSICCLKIHFMFIMFHYEAIESKVLKPTTSDLRLGSQSTSHRVPSLLSSLRVLKYIFAQTIILWQLPSQAIIIFINRTAYFLYKILFSNEHMEESLWLKFIRLCSVLLGEASFWIVHCTRQLLFINIRLKEGTKRNLTNPTSRLTSIMKNHVEGSGMVHTCNPSTPKTTRTLAWKNKFVTNLVYRMRLSQKKKTK